MPYPLMSRAQHEVVLPFSSHQHDANMTPSYLTVSPSSHGRDTQRVPPFIPQAQCNIAFPLSSHRHDAKHDIPLIPYPPSSHGRDTMSFSTSYPTMSPSYSTGVMRHHSPYLIPSIQRPTRPPLIPRCPPSILRARCNIVFSLSAHRHDMKCVPPRPTTTPSHLTGAMPPWVWFDAIVAITSGSCPTISGAVGDLFTVRIGIDVPRLDLLAYTPSWPCTSTRCIHTAAVFTRIGHGACLVDAWDGRFATQLVWVTSSPPR